MKIVVGYVGHVAISVKLVADLIKTIVYHVTHQTLHIRY